MAESLFHRIFQKLKWRIELPVFILFVGFMAADAVFSNLIIYRTCYVTLGYDKYQCSLLGSQHPNNETANLEKTVESFASVIIMCNVLLEGITSAIVCLFVGPWSDRVGRKPIQIVTIIGYLLYYLLLCLFSRFNYSSPWFSLMSFVPVVLTGGISSYISVVCCYITDLSSDENRGIQMSFLEAAICLGTFIGTLFSSQLLAAVGDSCVFLFAAFCCFIALVYTIFLPESLQERTEEINYRDIFQIDCLKDGIQTTFKKRHSYVRFTILSCVFMTMARVLIDNGIRSVLFLFLRSKFHWSLRKYTTYTALLNVVNVIGAVAGVFLLNTLLKIPETILIFVSLISTLNGAVMMALAETDLIMYIVLFAGSLNGVFGPMSRSLISKITPPEELGKIFSVYTAGQYFIGVGGSPLYTLIYNESINSHPELFSFFSVAILLLLIVLSGAVIVVRTVSRHLGSYQSIQGQDS